MPDFRHLAFCITCSVLAVLFTHCANPVTPEGGPKDSKSPKLISSVPENKTVNFSKNEIVLTFNKFIQLKDQNNQIIVSPPLKKNPDIKIKGKSLIIGLPDSLLENKTYTINFGNSIADITEANVLRNFRYVFSMGKYIDSLSVMGKVVNAFDNTPQKEVPVQMYARTDSMTPMDSLPLHNKPLYVAKTDENGLFDFENIQSGPLKLFALKDLNGNFIFDLSTENIAFCDSLVTGSYVPPQVIDTTRKDSLAKNKTPLHSDSLKILPGAGNFYSLRMFQEVDSTQKVKKVTLTQNDQVTVIFRFPVRQPIFRPLNFSADPGWIKVESNTGKDTINLWLKPVTNDSLILEISSDNRILDTARISLGDKNLKKKKEKKGEAVQRKVSVSSNIRDGKLNYFKYDPVLVFSYPVVNADFSRILLISDKDTVHPPALFQDSVKRFLAVKHKWKEDKNYKLIIPDSTFFCMDNLTNDSVTLTFKTQMLRDLGSIKIILKEPDPWQYNIVQLLSEKEDILEQKFLKGPGNVLFDYLSPGKYKIKCIFDRNRNGRWDTGKYRKKLQPEEVFYFPNIIEVRANWDIEENWEPVTGKN